MDRRTERAMKLYADDSRHLAYLRGLVGLYENRGNEPLRRYYLKSLLRVQLRTMGCTVEYYRNRP